MSLGDGVGEEGDGLWVGVWVSTGDSEGDGDSVGLQQHPVEGSVVSALDTLAIAAVAPSTTPAIPTAIVFNCFFTSSPFPADGRWCGKAA